MGKLSQAKVYLPPEKLALLQQKYPDLTDAKLQEVIGSLTLDEADEHTPPPSASKTVDDEAVEVVEAFKKQGEADLAKELSRTLFARTMLKIQREAREEDYGRGVTKEDLQETLRTHRLEDENESLKRERDFYRNSQPSGDRAQLVRELKPVLSEVKDAIQETFSHGFEFFRESLFHQRYDFLRSTGLSHEEAMQASAGRTIRTTPPRSREETDRLYEKAITEMERAEKEKEVNQVGAKQAPEEKKSKAPAPAATGPSTAGN